MRNVLDILQERNLLDAVTSPELRNRLDTPQTVYAGFDPTARSLGVGNCVTVMALAHFQRCGHKVVALIGGATGMIGDPSGKSSERNLLSEAEIEANMAGIREDLSKMLDFAHPTNPAKMVNNADWLKGFSFLAFLRDVGKHFRVGAMLAKESVRGRMESESGMSFTEFTYQILQAYDFLHLFDAEGCRVQIGGSDQWGNITAGTDLVRKLRGEETYGMTFPLVCDANGQKYGKSEGNSIYLSSRMTSCYNFYQFFLRTADADVARMLRIFTFLPLERIRELEEQVAKEPEKRVAQRMLAEEMTRAVHGERGLRVAQQASDVLFGGDMAGLGADDLLEIFSSVPSAELPAAQAVGARVVDMVAEAGVCASKGEARRLIAGGGLYLNGRRVGDAETRIAAGDVIDGRVMVVRSGKKSFHLIKVA